MSFTIGRQNNGSSPEALQERALEASKVKSEQFDAEIVAEGALAHEAREKQQQKSNIEKIDELIVGFEGLQETMRPLAPNAATLCQEYIANLQALKAESVGHVTQANQVTQAVNEAAHALREATQAYLATAKSESPTSHDEKERLKKCYEAASHRQIEATQKEGEVHLENDQFQQQLNTVLTRLAKEIDEIRKKINELITKICNNIANSR